VTHAFGVVAIAAIDDLKFHKIGGIGRFSFHIE
jgi:hypothetical protein